MSNRYTLSGGPEMECEIRWVRVSKKTGKRYVLYCVERRGHAGSCMFFKSCDFLKIPSTFRKAGIKGDGRKFK